MYPVFKHKNNFLRSIIKRIFTIHSFPRVTLSYNNIPSRVNQTNKSKIKVIVFRSSFNRDTNVVLCGKSVSEEIQKWFLESKIEKTAFTKGCISTGLKSIHKGV